MICGSMLRDRCRSWEMEGNAKSVRIGRIGKQVVCEPVSRRSVVAVVLPLASRFEFRIEGRFGKGDKEGKWGCERGSGRSVDRWCGPRRAGEDGNQQQEKLERPSPCVRYLGQTQPPTGRCCPGFSRTRQRNNPTGG